MSSESSAHEKQLQGSAWTMKKIRDNNIPLNDGLLPEYRFDYKHAKSNRFADKLSRDIELVTLDPDVANVFKDA